MKTIVYNKLIRDRIPEIIEKSDKKPIVEKAAGDKLLYLLNIKLEEELDEYKKSGNIEELADLVEVVYGVLDFKGITLEEFENIRKEKNRARGAFKEVERNIFTNPFKRFEDMNFMKRSRDIEYIEINRHIMKKLTNEEIEWIVEHCDKKLEEYYGKKGF